MSTSDKLTYLNETKQRQKNLINALGGEITNDTPFREYEKELVGVLPKVTGEGTNISLSPTIEYDLEVGSLKGDTKQDTLTGKNLYPSGTSTQTIGGITFTPQINGSIKLQGTSTYANYYVAGGDNNYVEVPHLSNLSEEVTLSVTGMQTGIQVYVVGTSLGVKGLLEQNGSVSFTTIQNDTYRLFIRVMASNTVNTTLYIQLEKGSTATSYEPYCGGIPSPNPRISSRYTSSNRNTRNKSMW